MKELWQQRLTAHLKQQSKFLKLVFNEYFIIAIIFMLGAFGFWYSKAIDHLPVNAWWIRPVGIIILTVAASLFKIATFLQDADATFLLPKEKMLRKYLKNCRNYSLILPIATLVIVGFFLTPFWARGAKFTPLEVVLVTLVALIAELGVINNHLRSLYLWKNNSWQLESLAGVLIALIVAVYLNLWAGIVVAMLFVGITFYQLQRIKQPLNWLYAIKKENQRSYQLKRFYNLFTDVPGISSKVKRRRWCDGLLKVIKNKPQNTYLYLFMRGFIRNTDYSGLFLRLTVLAIILLYAIDNTIIVAIMAALFIYLVEFQLIPLYKHYDRNVLLKIYPLTVQQKNHSFKLLLWMVLLIQWGLLTIALLISKGITTIAFVASGVSLLFLVAMIVFYLPRQLKKLNS